MQISNAPAYDPSGRKFRIAIISAGADRYAIETDELSKLLLYGRKCPIRHITHHFGVHLGGAAGAASLSYSKKGLVLEICQGRRYMVSRNSAAALLKGYMNYSAISEMPAPPETGIHSCSSPTFQSTITPWVAV